MEDFKPNIVDVNSSDITDITSMNASLERKSNSLIRNIDLDQPMIQLTIPGFENIEELVLERCLPKLTTLLETIVLSNKSEVDELRQLQEISEQGWWITTLQVKKLLGVAPKLQKNETQWQRGCFIFSKIGKIGNQTAWKVSRIPD